MKVKMKTGITVILLTLVSLAVNAEEIKTTELQEPKAIKVIEPYVPVEFSRAKVSGKVEVSFKLDDLGRPGDIRIENASHAEYAESVVNALRQWRYEQGPKGKVRYYLPVLFN